MLQPVFFTTIKDHHIPCTGLFCIRFGRHLLPGTHIIFTQGNNEEKYVGCIISCANCVKALINKYDYYSNWNIGRSTPVLTDSWSLGLQELVITDYEVKISQLDVIDIAFVLLENNLNEYRNHGPLQGIDNVCIVQYNDDGSRMLTFHSFSTDYLVPGEAAVCKIQPEVVVSTHDLCLDYCKQVFNGVKQIQLSVLSSLNRRSAKQSDNGTVSSKFHFSEMVFQYVVQKTGKTISDCNNKKRRKYDYFLLQNMDFIKRIRKYDYTGISFITDDDIKKFI